MKYESVIGLEVHVQMKTATKLFCSCRAAFGEAPNTCVCPVCSGQPGALPVLNAQALETGVTASLALNCSVPPRTRFDRKNYFYPDLPKGYQITQYALPIGRNGSLTFDLPDGSVRTITVRRVHIEEDAGKTIHDEESDRTLVDLNRAGVPLLEIVSEPWAGSPAEARAYLEELKRLMQYAGVSDCDMEKGSLRCDANVSLRPKGASKLGMRTEVKNLNSFRNVERALRYERSRHAAILDSGGTVEQDTRLWIEDQAATAVMRTKEEAHDYRYFREPDLPFFTLAENLVAACRSLIPENPRARRERFVGQYGLALDDARRLTAEREMADYFESCLDSGGNARELSKWIVGPVLEELNRRDCTIAELGLTPSGLSGLADMVTSGRVSRLAAARLLGPMIDGGRDPEELAAERDLLQISDDRAIERMVQETIARNAAMAEQYRNGKDSVLNALVGMVMKSSAGRANPQKVRVHLQRLLRP